MHFLFSGLFWGIFLIVLGISLLLKVLFQINIPVVKIFFSLFFIYLGLSIITNGFGTKRGTAFSDVHVNAPNNNDEYNIVFGKGKVNLNKIDVKDHDISIKINTVFGGTDVYINPDIPTQIQIESVFAGARLPDDTVISFGTNVYKTKSYSPGAPALKVTVSAVFGGVNIIEAHNQ